MGLKIIVTGLSILISCLSPKQVSEIRKENRITEAVYLPVWIEYSSSVPDSIRDFSRTYFQSKHIRVIGMKEAMELIMSNSNTLLMNKMQSGSITSEKEITEIVEQSASKPSCSKLGMTLFRNENENQLIIDSIRWNVIPMPLKDTILKRNQYVFYPAKIRKENIFLEWKSFLDTVLASGLLK